MARKKDKESKLDKLGKIAQIMQLLGASGRDSAQLAQQAKGQNMQTILAMLGLTQAEKNANADRGLRERGMTMDDTFRTAQVGREDARFDKKLDYDKSRDKVGDERYAGEFGYRKDRDKAGDVRDDRKQNFAETSTQEQLMQAWQRMQQEKDIAEKGLDFRDKDSRTGVIQSLLPGAQAQGSAKLGELLKIVQANDPEFRGLEGVGASERAAAAARQAEIDSTKGQPTASPGSSKMGEYFTSVNPLIFGPTQMGKLLADKVNNAPVDMSGEFLPPRLPLNFSSGAGLPPGLAPLADPKLSPLLGAKPDWSKLLKF